MKSKALLSLNVSAKFKQISASVLLLAVFTVSFAEKASAQVQGLDRSTESQEFRALAHKLTSNPFARDYNMIDLEYYKGAKVIELLDVMMFDEYKDLGKHASVLKNLSDGITTGEKAARQLADHKWESALPLMKKGLAEGDSFVKRGVIWAFLMKKKSSSAHDVTRGTEKNIADWSMQVSEQLKKIDAAKMDCLQAQKNYVQAKPNKSTLSQEFSLRESYDRLAHISIEHGKEPLINSIWREKFRSITDDVRGGFCGMLF